MIRPHGQARTRRPLKSGIAELTFKSVRNIPAIGFERGWQFMKPPRPNQKIGFLVPGGGSIICVVSSGQMPTNPLRFLPLLALMLAALQLGRPASGEEIPLVDLIGGNAFDLGPGCDKLQVIVPITPNGNLNTSVNPEVVWVRFGNQSNETLRRAFAASWETQNDPHAIKITVENYAAIAQSGAYDVTLGLKSKDGTAGQKLLKLQIIHPPAKLRSPLDILIIERTRWFPFLPDYATLSSISLSLTEISKRSCLTGLRIQPIHNAAIGDRQVTGHLRFLMGNRAGNKDATIGDEVASAKLEAGGHTNVGYETEGDFPLGTVKGSLEVSAAELSDALPLNFEVRSRLASIYILVFIVFGLFMSYFLKRKLQPEITLGQALIQGRRLLKHVEDEAFPDSEFHTNIGEALKKLKQVLTGSDAVAVSTASNELDKAFSDARQRLFERRALLQKQIDGFLVITRNDWEVPTVIRKVLEDARGKMNAIEGFMKKNDIGNAESAFRLFKIKFPSALKDAISNWEDGIKSYWETIKAAKQGITATTKAMFAKIADDEIKRVIDPLQFGNTDQAPEVALQNVVIAREHALRVAKGLEQAIQADVTNAKNILDTAKLSQETRDRLNAAFSKLQSIVKSRASSAVPAADDPAAELTELERQLSEMNHSWLEMMLDQESKPPVKASFESQDYVEALRQAVKALGVSTGVVVDALDASAEELTESQFWQPSASADIPPAFPRVVTESPNVVASSHLDKIRIEDENQLKWAKRKLSMIIGVILLLIGYGLYREKFVGNFSDFLLIFFWAFGLDVTLDTVVKLAGQKT